MKTKHLLPVVILTFCIFILLSCDPQNDSSTDGKNDVVQANVDWCTTNCMRNIVKGEVYEIDSTCALCWEKNFVKRQCIFPKVDSAGVDTRVRGVHIPYGDLKEVMAMVDSLFGENEVSVYSMFGIEADSSGALTPKVILQVQGIPRLKGGSTAVAAADPVNVYFDFTNPCPTFCPK